MKNSKQLNRNWKNHCNFYWGKYITGGWLKIMKFELYLSKCHLF